LLVSLQLERLLASFTKLFPSGLQSSSDIFVSKCTENAYYFLGFARTQDEYCKSCNNLVVFAGHLNTQLQKTPSIREDLIRWCVESGDNSNRQICTILIDDSIRQFRKISSDGFCYNIKACEKFSGVVGRLPQVLNGGKYGDNTSCEFCLNIVTHVKEIISSPETQAEVQEVLDNSCKYLGELRNECQDLINENLNTLFEYLREQLQPKVLCDEIGLCQKQINRKPAVPAISDVVNLIPDFTKAQAVAGESKYGKVNVGPTCPLCKKLMTMIDQMLDGNRTEEAIEWALDKVCDILPSVERRECDHYVQKYTPNLVQAIKLATEPEVACALCGLCDPFADANCDMCKILMNYLYSQLKKNATEAEIKAALDTVCEEVMPRRDVAKCENIVNQYTDEIIKMIVEEVQPDVACKMLGMCAKVKSHVPLTKIRKANKVKKVKGQVCDICRQVFEFIHNEVANPKVTNAIVDALSKVCDIKVDPAVRKECKEFVQKKLSQIVDEAAQGTQPDVACRKLGVCTYNHRSNRVSPISKNIRNETCYVCELTAHYIQNELYNSNNEKNINQFIEHELCNRLKHFVEREVCKRYIKTYGPVIEQSIAQNVFDPKYLCNTELRLCPSTSFIKPGNQSSLAKKIRVCEVCKESVNQLDHMLLKGSVEKTFVDLAAKTCHGSVNDEAQCRQIVENCGLQLITWIGRLNNAKEVCETVSLCQTQGKIHVAENRCVVNLN